MALLPIQYPNNAVIDFNPLNSALENYQQQLGINNRLAMLQAQDIRAAQLHPISLRSHTAQAVGAEEANRQATVMHPLQAAALQEQNQQNLRLNPLNVRHQTVATQTAEDQYAAGAPWRAMAAELGGGLSPQGAPSPTSNALAPAPSPVVSPPAPRPTPQTTVTPPSAPPTNTGLAPLPGVAVSPPQQQTTAPAANPSEVAGARFIQDYILNAPSAVGQARFDHLRRDPVFGPVIEQHGLDAVGWREAAEEMAGVRVSPASQQPQPLAQDAPQTPLQNFRPTPQVQMPPSPSAPVNSAPNQRPQQGQAAPSVDPIRNPALGLLDMAGRRYAAAAPPGSPSRSPDPFQAQPQAPVAPQPNQSNGPAPPANQATPRPPAPSVQTPPNDAVIAPVPGETPAAYVRRVLATRSPAEQLQVLGMLSSPDPAQRNNAMTQITNWANPGLEAQKLQQEAAARERGTQQGTAQNNLPAANNSGRQMLESIDAVLADPNLASVTGWQSSRPLSWIPYVGTQGLAVQSRDRETMARIEQLQGQAFLQAYQRLRGSGAISDTESSRATAAMARLQALDTGDAGYRTALHDARREVVALIQLAHQNAGRTPPPASQFSNPAHNNDPANPYRPQAQQDPNRRTIDGRNYRRVDGQWFQE